MTILLDEYIEFPSDIHNCKAFERLCSFFDCVEGAEIAFRLEFSCGDGKYLSDIENNTSELSKYDGLVSLEYPARLNPVKMSQVQEVLKNTARFTIKHYPSAKEVVFYVNGKERSRKSADSYVAQEL
jgi:hypothetical protein